jgi:hypothetical protein
MDVIVLASGAESVGFFMYRQAIEQTRVISTCISIACSFSHGFSP